MKESIFFNKEQLKIIHWYGIVYKGVFRYWVTTISLILSFIALGYFVFSSCFSPKFIAEEALSSSTESQDFYVDKQQTVFAISGLTAKILNGKIESNTEGFNSENNLLEMEGLVLPELTSLSFENLRWAPKWWSFQRCLSKEVFFNSNRSSLKAAVFIQRNCQTSSLKLKYSRVLWA